MKKIPTLFKRVFSPDHKTKTILPEVTPGCEAVLEGRCIPTVKWDGACCAIINGEIYKRYDAKVGKNGKRKMPPEGAIPCQPEPDPITGHWPHWVKCDPANPADKYLFVALENFKNRITEDYFFRVYCRDDIIQTFEAIGPHWQSNPYHLDKDTLVRHGDDDLTGELGVMYDWTPTQVFESCQTYLRNHEIEGIVFWLNDKPLCKIKRSDFGFPWPVKP